MMAAAIWSRVEAHLGEVTAEAIHFLGDVAALGEDRHADLLELIDWCLQLDPLARPQSVYALQKALIHRHAGADRPENWFSDLGNRLKSFIGRS